MADTDDVIIDGGPIASPEDAQLDALARSEDASSYIAERQAQEAEEQGKEPETPTDERQTRIDEALAKAREDTRQAREANGHLDQEWQQAQAEYQAQQQAEQQAAQQQEAWRLHNEGRGRLMAENARMKVNHPEMHATISNNLGALEQVLNEDQRAALEIAFVRHPHAVWVLGLKLSDDSDGTTFSDKLDTVMRASPAEILNAAAQGAAQFERERYVNLRIMQDRVAQGRRVSNAPRPITPPRGSANVPRDIHQLAGKSDITDYARMRRAQMARDERDR
jgi:hypothetical protein